MKFALASDLHLVFGGFDRLPVASTDPEVKTLVLAGDIVEVDLLKQKTRQREEVVEYLRKLDQNFETVIYVMGNHEHYDNSFSHTAQNLRSQFKAAGLKNFVLLEKDTIEVEDAIFFGATMWTSFRNGDPQVMSYAHGYMNDYKCIYVMTPYGEKTLLTPDVTAAQCKITLDKLKKFALLETDKKKVLVTHHAPCSMSIDVRWRANMSNDAYYEDISDILLDSNIRVAVHGHIHQPVCYALGDTYVTSNPRGYFGYEPEAYTYDFFTVNV